MNTQVLSGGKSPKLRQGFCRLDGVLFGHWGEPECMVILTLKWKNTYVAVW